LAAINKRWWVDILDVMKVDCEFISIPLSVFTAQFDRTFGKSYEFYKFKCNVKFKPN